MKFYLLKYFLFILPAWLAMMLAIMSGMVMLRVSPELGMAAALASSAKLFLYMGGAVLVTGIMALWWMDDLELSSYNSHRDIPGLGHRLCVIMQAGVVGYITASMIISLPASMAPPSVDAPWGLMFAATFVIFAVMHYLLAYWLFLTTKRRDKIMGPLAKLLYGKKR